MKLMNGVQEAVETKEVKEVKEVKVPLTNYLVGITDEHIAALKGKAVTNEIAELLKAGHSKSEVLAILKAKEETEGLAEGAKPITHQIIYAVYKRLLCMSGVEVAQKELVSCRKPRIKKDVEEPNEVAKASEEFTEAAGEAKEAGEVEEA